MSDSLSVCKSCHKLNRFSLEKARSKAAFCGECGQPLELHGAVTDVSEKDFWRILQKSDKPVIVDFWASWCGPCKMYGPIFQEASLSTDKAVFLKVDTESNPQLSQQFGIRGIPSTLVFKDSKEIKRQSGALDMQGVLSLI